MRRFLPALLSLGLIAGGCTASEEDPALTPGSGSTPAAERSPTGTPATPRPTPVAGLTPAAGDTPAVLVLDSSPRTNPAVTPRALLTFVPSTLPVPDPRDTVLYEAATNTATNLGPGTQGQFSPDSKLMTFSTLAGNNPTEVYIVDLATKEKRSLALGREPRFWGNDRLVFFTGATERTVLDLKTGQQTLMPADTVFPDFSVMDIPGGSHRLKVIPPSPTALANRFTYVVEEVAGEKAILQFEASQALPAGIDEVVVASPPAGGTTNIFLIDVKTGAFTFVATARWLASNWPLSANANHVAWTEAYCDFANPGKTRIFDRRTRTIAELDRSFWVRLTPDGKLAPGEFGGKSLIDVSTLQTSFVLPGADSFDRGRDVAWSADYRFASTGFVGGHGGNCG